MRAIVTGAASGIGRATALRLAADARPHGGARLMIVDVAAERLDAVAAELRNQAEVVSFVGDLADPAVPARIATACAESLGGLDVLVSNAGILTTAPLAELALDDYDRTFAINARATWLLAKAVLPLLKESRGCLIATASISAEEPTPPLAAYSASKAALLMLVRQLAYEWGPYGIRCNCVSPGATHTGMTDAVYSDPARRAERASHIPLGRIGLPDDLAGAVAFLAGPDARYITGVNLPVDGGMQTTLMPTLRRASSSV